MKDRARGRKTAPAHTYDPLNRLTDIVNKNGSNAVVSSYHYQLRADGKRSSVTDGTGTTAYTYDDQGKMTQEAGPYATITYIYDNVGNRLTRTVTNAATGNGTTLITGITNTAYDGNDRIVGHTYDANGSETTVNGQAASYDFENHLIALGSVANYVYDADGNRTSVSSAGATINYVVDTSLPYASVVEEYNGTTLAARYDYGGDLLRMDRTSPASVSYYLYDGLGSTRQLVNTGGAVTDTWGYSAFGEMAAHTGTTANPFLFNAQQFDGASGNYFLRARYYDQSTGRFISQDPFEGVDNNPISLHRYFYTADDPVNYTDPGGRDLGETLVAIGITTALSALSYIAISAGSHAELQRNEGDSYRYYYPNISSELRTTVARIRASWSDPRNASVRDQAANALTDINPVDIYNGVPTALGEWDILDLTNTASTSDNWIDTATSPHLENNDANKRLVRVDGQTYHDYSVNYVAFGVMMRTAGLSRWKTQSMIREYKAVYGYLDEKAAEEWALAGWDGWPAVNGPTSSLVSAGDSDLPVQHFKVDWPPIIVF